MSGSNISPKAVLGLLLLCALALLAWYSIEFYEDTEESSWSLEARRNP